MVKYKESESESEDTSPASEPRFRVRVCMQRFYNNSDARARAYVCVSPNRRVRWLQRRLRRLFALPRLRLLSRGFLLPPQEPLTLLQPDDPVEVIPANPDDAAAPRNVVASVDDLPVTTVESRPSPSNVHQDDLTETKLQALMMLEQFCVAPATECAADSVAESPPRLRRRRVRRRRRIPTGAGVSQPCDGSAPAPECRRPVPPGAGDSQPCDGQAPTSECRDPEAMVLRNELQPRAARVVRSLPDGITVTSAISRPLTS